MTPRHAESKSFIGDSLAAYIESVSLREPPVLAKLREETGAHPERVMQITPAQGQFLQLLVKAIGARRALEIGVFTGYSSLAVALALPEDGRVTALDLSDEYTSVARRYWKEAGVSHKIDLRLGPAVQSLDQLIADGRTGTYDLAFIDADKPSYGIYFERCLTLLRPGGLIAVDNTLQSGKVADPKNREANTLVIREFNRNLHADGRVLPSLLPLADGLTLAVKL
jgi:caffeoyl-CoA O-methyltransferase